MEAIFRDMYRMQFQLGNLQENGIQRVNETMQLLKHCVLCVAEIALRLPGLILLELWWRKFDMTFDEFADQLRDDPQVHSYVDVDALLKFVHTRNIEQAVANVFSCSVFCWSLTFLTISMENLLRLYCHFISAILFGVAHFLSIRYVQIEENTTEPMLKLDSFAKLERHGFYFLAQLMLAVLHSILLNVTSEIGRMCLTFFVVPIMARMLSVPPKDLILAHNVACALFAICLCAYVMHKVPKVLESVYEGARTLRALFATRGLVVGAASIWRRCQLSELLTWAWLTMFALRCYHEMIEKGRPWSQTWPVIIEGIAETTNTPLTMLALALTVSCVCHWALTAAQWFLSAHSWQPQHVLAHSQYMECCFLLLLCTHTGLIGMKNEQKATLLGLVLFIVLSALLHSLVDLAEMQLQMLATSRDHGKAKHVKAICLAAGLVFGPVVAASTAYAYLHWDLWCCILLSNCFTTSVHSFSAILHYLITRAEVHAETFSMADTLAFTTTLIVKGIEIVCTILATIIGCVITVSGEWTLASVGAILLQIGFNIVQKIDVVIELFQRRSEAQANLDRLPIASREQLKKNADVCAICLQEMGETEEIRVTPCTHLFHSPCLKKWLSVKQVCPLCYADLSLPKKNVGNSSRTTSISSGTTPRRRRGLGDHHRSYEAELLRMHRHLEGARDMWPLTTGLYDSEDYDSHSSDEDLLHTSDEEENTHSHPSDVDSRTTEEDERTSTVGSFSLDSDAREQQPSGNATVSR